jgi:hypothetical protein
MLAAFAAAFRAVFTVVSAAIIIAFTPLAAAAWMRILPTMFLPYPVSLQ